MSEWILVLTLNLMSANGDVRDVSPEIISGFSSKQTCDVAAKDISYKLIDLVGNHREQQGVARGSKKNGPSIYYECILIKK